MLFLFLLVALQDPVVSPDQEAVPELTVIVPAKPSVIIDGTLDQDEWAGARLKSMLGGAEVLLQQDGDDIAIGVRGPEAGWSHVCLSDGRTVLVLHASTSLGSSVYELEAGVWKATQSFDWELSEIKSGDEADAERAEYYAKHGWVASTVGVGQPLETEYRVSRRMLRGRRLWAAVVFARAGKVPLCWPTTVRDGAVDPDLVFGETPELLSFEPSGWASLVMFGRPSADDR